MNISRRVYPISLNVILIVAFACLSAEVLAQPQAVAGGPSSSGKPGKPVTIPVTIRLKEEQREPELQNIDLTISEDGEPQTIYPIKQTEEQNHNKSRR